MQEINLKKEDLNKLKRFFPSTLALGIESRLYLYPENNKLRVIKEIKNISDNKLLTIKLLNKYCNDINIEELVLESDILYVDNKPVGNVTDYIEGTVLSNIIYNKNTSINYKIEILKKISNVLKSLKQIRDNGIEFYIGDLHEDNIIVTKDNNIKICDMDSSKIMNNEPFPSKYLTRMARRKKYKNFIITPTESTDNYCFNMIVLNALFSKDMSKLKISDFNRHILYLDSIGVDKSLLNNFYSMYSDNNVQNLYNELDSLKIHDKVYLK